MIAKIETDTHYLDIPVKFTALETVAPWSYREAFDQFDAYEKQALSLPTGGEWIGVMFDKQYTARRAR